MADDQLFQLAEPEPLQCPLCGDGFDEGDTVAFVVAESVLRPDVLNFRFAHLACIEKDDAESDD